MTVRELIARECKGCEYQNRQTPESTYWFKEWMTVGIPRFSASRGSAVTGKIQRLLAGAYKGNPRHSRP